MRRLRRFYTVILSAALLSLLGCASHQTRLPGANAGPGPGSGTAVSSTSNHPGDLALLDDPATDADPDPAQLTVPEPETAYLIGIGLLGLYLTRRRK